MKKLFILFICIGFTLACTKKKFTNTHSFWYDATTADDLAAYGINKLTLLVDGTEIATIDAYNHYTVDPGCGSGNFVYTDKMFKKENKTHAYKIVNEADSTIFEGTFMMQQKTPCESTKLVFGF